MKSIIYAYIQGNEGYVSISNHRAFARDLDTIQQLIRTLHIDHDEEYWDYLASLTTEELIEVLLDAKHHNESLVFYPN